MTETSGHQAPPEQAPASAQAQGEAERSAAPETPARQAPSVAQALDETPVGDYPERPFAEASEGVPNFDPARLDHQEVRLAQGIDYVEDTKALFPGYDPPRYGDAEA